MIDRTIHYLSIGTMFAGKNLPLFLEETAPMFRSLVELHGREKVDKVYRYFFDFVSRMKWGQWMVLTKVCPDHDDRQLFYWVMELIYQSDLCSQMRWKWAPVGDKDELRILVVPPTPEQIKRWAPFIGQDCYLYIDWYGRLLRDPNCHPDIKPEWLMLEARSQWGSGTGQPDDVGEVMPPPED